MTREELKDNIVKVVDKHGRAMHYDDIAFELSINETSCNTLCNELFNEGRLVKPKSGWFGVAPITPPPAEETPWDMSPATPGQIRYISELANVIGTAQMDAMDITVASQVIDRLNSVRRLMGIEFREFGS